jgi:hypothetical protein
MSRPKNFKFVVSLTPSGTKTEAKATVEKKLGTRVYGLAARASKPDEARFIVSVTPNGKTTRAEEKARVEKRLGKPVSHLGHVLQAARATEARKAQRASA